MKQILYLFNPENDMALACGDPYYMAPASARKMAADLSALPGWYADEGAWVVLASEAQVVWMEETASAAGTERLAVATGSLAVDKTASVAEMEKSAESITGIGRCFAPPSVRWLSLSEGATGEGRDLATAARICPWGWNPSLVRRLREAGVSDMLLPDDCQMQAIRTLSGRQTAVRVLQRLKERWMKSQACPFELLGESFVFTTDSEVRAFVEGRPKALLKAPWSGSGRGVQYTQGLFSAPLQGWVRHILHTQQTVVGEPFYDKVIDFAMEFRVEAPSASSNLSSVSSNLSSASPDLSSVSPDLSSASSASASAPHSSVRFVGYSWFETDARGIYKENWLASDAAIEARLAAYVPVEVLHRIRKGLEEELDQALQGTYEGYLGVDMMVCRGSAAGSYALHPCVEINLRTNMGVVARRLYDSYVCPASQGRYVIEYYPQPGEALRRHRAMQEAHPLVVEGGRLRSGYFSLTPVLEDTHYQAYGIVEEGEPFRSVMAHFS